MCSSSPSLTGAALEKQCRELRDLLALPESALTRLKVLHPFLALGNTTVVTITLVSEVGSSNTQMNLSDVSATPTQQEQAWLIMVQLELCPSQSTSLIPPIFGIMASYRGFHTTKRVQNLVFIKSSLRFFAS